MTVKKTENASSYGALTIKLSASWEVLSYFTLRRYMRRIVLATYNGI